MDLSIFSLSVVQFDRLSLVGFLHFDAEPKAFFHIQTDSSCSVLTSFVPMAAFALLLAQYNNSLCPAVSSHLDDCMIAAFQLLWEVHIAGEMAPTEMSVLIQVESGSKSGIGTSSGCLGF